MDFDSSRTVTLESLNVFSEEIHDILACYSVAKSGVNRTHDDLASAVAGGAQLGTTRESTLFFGPYDPATSPPLGRLKIGTYLDRSAVDGHYSDLLAKAHIVYLYARWEVHYRPLVAQELGVKIEQVCCDVMGDLRLIRNALLHAAGITNEHQRIRKLPWKLAPGPLHITSNMMYELSTCAQPIEVYVKVEAK